MGATCGRTSAVAPTTAKTPANANHATAHRDLAGSAPAPPSGDTDSGTGVDRTDTPPACQTGPATRGYAGAVTPDLGRQDGTRGRTSPSRRHRAAAYGARHAPVRLGRHRGPPGWVGDGGPAPQRFPRGSQGDGRVAGSARDSY